MVTLCTLGHSYFPKSAVATVYKPVVMLGHIRIASTATCMSDGYGFLNVSEACVIPLMIFWIHALLLMAEDQ